MLKNRNSESNSNLNFTHINYEQNKNCWRHYH